jgi:hypothetical protein
MPAAPGMNPDEQLADPVEVPQVSRICCGRPRALQPLRDGIRASARSGRGLSDFYPICRLAEQPRRVRLIPIRLNRRPTFTTPDSDSVSLGQRLRSFFAPSGLLTWSTIAFSTEMDADSARLSRYFAPE